MCDAQESFVLEFRLNGVLDVPVGLVVDGGYNRGDQFKLVTAIYFLRTCSFIHENNSSISDQSASEVN